MQTIRSVLFKCGYNQLNHQHGTHRPAGSSFSIRRKVSQIHRSSLLLRFDHKNRLRLFTARFLLTRMNAFLLRERVSVDIAQLPSHSGLLAATVCRFTVGLLHISRLNCRRAALDARLRISRRCAWMNLCLPKERRQSESKDLCIDE